MIFGAISASPARRRVDGLDEQLGSGVLEQEPAGSRLQRAVHVLVEVEGRDDDDRHRVLDAGPGELPGRLDPVQAGHPDVEQADVGTKLARQRHRLAPVGRLARPPRCRAVRRGSSRAPSGPAPGRRRPAPGWSCGSARPWAAPRRRSSPAPGPGRPRTCRRAAPPAPSCPRVRSRRRLVAAEPPPRRRCTVRRTQSASPATRTWIRVACARVPHGVGHRLLGDPVDRRPDRGPEVVEVTRQVDLDARARSPSAAGEPLEVGHAGLRGERRRRRRRAARRP